MSVRERTIAAVLAGLICLVGHVRAVPAQGLAGLLFEGQTRLEIRSPEQLPPVALPPLPAPRTVIQADEYQQAPSLNLSLDDALRIALANTEVVRVLSGSSGRTIYDPAITGTEIDQARAAFDPSLTFGSDWERSEVPQAESFVVSGNPSRVQISDAATGTDPNDPSKEIIKGTLGYQYESGVRIGGESTDDYLMGLEASKKTVTGGTAGLKVQANPVRSSAGSLNPQSSSSVDLEYRQPLLQGGGRRANLAPIFVARIETEISYYQLKGSLQQMVSDVVEAYWSLVFARVDVWAREQQVKQNQLAYDEADARLRTGLQRHAGDVAQARSTLANFRAQLVTARATLLQREAALRNILGIPPSDGREIVPLSPPNADWIETEWSAVLQLAAQYRPDLIQQKLILEQDEQKLLLARNQSLPKVDAAGRYRWSHLEGRAANGLSLAAGPGQFTGWQLGVEVSLPLALADARAKLRQQELALMRDRANLNQALHQASHELSSSYQNLAQFFEEYKAYQQTRKASRTNLDVQAARYSNGLTIYLDVLQAISAWGNAVDSEAQALLQYNTELANLERHTGTILQSHGIHFNEGGFPSVGRLGRLFPDHCYPADIRPGPNRDRYPAGASPSENAFQLGDLDVPRRRTPGAPRRRIDSPSAPRDEPLEPPQPTAEDLRRLFLPPSDPQPLPPPLPE